MKDKRWWWRREGGRMVVCVCVGGVKAKRTERGKEIERDRESEEKEKQQGKTLTIELPDFLRNSAAEYLAGWRRSRRGRRRGGGGADR